MLFPACRPLVEKRLEQRLVKMGERKEAGCPAKKTMVVVRAVRDPGSLSRAPRPETAGKTKGERDSELLTYLAIDFTQSKQLGARDDDQCLTLPQHI